jgi:hypothetical protein
VLLQRLLVAEGSIAGLTVEGRGMNRGVAEVLLQSRPGAEVTVASSTVEGVSGRFSFVLLRAFVTIERLMAESTVGAHSVKVFIPVLIQLSRRRNDDNRKR